jgi:hypothetical protein
MVVCPKSQNSIYGTHSPLGVKYYKHVWKYFLYNEGSRTNLGFDIPSTYLEKTPNIHQLFFKQIEIHCKYIQIY